jgi:hypothetical protein
MSPLYNFLIYPGKGVASNRKQKKNRYGERGIRTLVRVTPKQHFQCCAFNHSAISPQHNQFNNIADSFLIMQELYQIKEKKGGRARPAMVFTVFTLTKYLLFFDKTT